MIEINVCRGEVNSISLARLYCAHKKCMNIQLQLNFDKMLIFNISILKRAIFKIVYICNSILLFNHYKITLKDIIYTNRYVSAICFLFLLRFY